MSDSTVGRLRFDTVVTTDGLRSGMNRAREIVKGGVGAIGGDLSRFGGFGGAFGGVGSKLGLSMPSQLGDLVGGFKAPGMMGLGAAAGLYATVQKFAGDAQELQRNSQKLGLGVDQYQELERASKKSGLSIDQTAAGLNRLRRSVFEANEGNKGLDSVFQQLGLSAQKLERLNPGQQLEQVAAALSKISDPNKRFGLEEALFGRAGGEMDPMLMKMGRGGLKQYGKWYDLNAAEASVLAEQKNAVLVDATGAAKKLAANAGIAVNAIGAEIGGWFGGRMGMGAEYARDMRAMRDTQQNQNRAAATAAQRAIDEENKKLHGFGGMAMAGSQEAYALSMASKYGVTDKADLTNMLLQQQLDVMQGGGGGGKQAV